MKSRKGIQFEFEPRLSAISFEGFDPRDLFKASSHLAISRSLQFMEENFTRAIKIRDVVAISGMSRRGFMKAFRRHVGCAPGVFMRRARIKFATQLLIEHDLPLKAIATTVGFRSENTFCIAFRRATGMAPKKFRSQVCSLVNCSSNLN